MVRQRLMRLGQVLLLFQQSETLLLKRLYQALAHQPFLVRSRLMGML
jgi:hypothetical protein